MEKKSRLPQSSSKGTTGDAKKNQDIVNTKLFPRSSRKREPIGITNLPKNEQSRKSYVPKGKSHDKRPKPKGQYHGSPKEDTKVEEKDVAEYGSVMVQGSRKQNLNHLLNFHYEPRDIRGVSNTRNLGRFINKYNQNSNRWLPPVQRRKYNTEQFLQANCQFVVKSDGDYTAYLADPDTLVQWNLIEQIRVHSSEILSCPICLCVPVAGKMTRCGHVYCLACILHYLAISDKPLCPICGKYIDKSDLKSFVQITQKVWNVDDTVTLRLMRRERGSLLAIPVGDSFQAASPTTFFTLLQDDPNIIYSKLLLADFNKIIDIIECERVQLQLELAEDAESSENYYIEQALRELATREQELFAKATYCSLDREAAENKIKEDVKESQSKSKVEVGEKESESSKDSACESGEILVPCAHDSISKRQTLTALPKFFYFYQADDGQHIYLHAMNVKMLELQYGSLENSPSTVTGKLLEKETCSMTEELRRRLRYLYHLPLTCQFGIAEIQLKPPIISRANLSVFNAQLVTRKNRRLRRERDEQYREKRIMEEENKRIGKYPTPNVHIESHRHFPRWQSNSPSVELNIPSSPESVVSSVASSPTMQSLNMDLATADSRDSGPSFAEMLRTTGSQGSSKINVPASSACNWPQQRGAALTSISDSEEVEGYAPAPSYSQSFSDALATALEHTELQPTGSSESHDSASGKKKKKKKKGKATVLFATNMARAS
ncbi:RING finger protein 10 isoform X1 [Neodiprion virginianus]|uniref:RING finger protein 10 isoform X1 n=1 Tax=Neodiprion virginianus TaxID=2961670 RepID=UPI001EE70141|nr:RING finger protein 10 isoform X1 [Neodiprion virginianus]